MTMYLGLRLAMFLQAMRAVLGEEKFAAVSAEMPSKII